MIANKKVGVFIQARLNSKRFPRKMLERVYDFNVIETCILAASRINANKFSLLVPQSDYNEFSDCAKKFNIDIFPGSETDVLDRFCRAIEKYDVDYVVRVNGDKIIMSTQLQNNMIEEIYESGADMISYDDCPVTLTVTNEVIKSSALLEAEKIIKEEQCREHVKPCLYILSKLNKAKLISKETPIELRHLTPIRTVDTKEDLEILKELFKIKNKNIINYYEALSFYNGFVEI
jgi:spore coat polysaccharide biosynthesis protein SpsF